MMFVFTITESTCLVVNLFVTGHAHVYNYISDIKFPGSA